MCTAHHHEPAVATMKTVASPATSRGRSVDLPRIEGVVRQPGRWHGSTARRPERKSPHETSSLGSRHPPRISYGGRPRPGGTDVRLVRVPPLLPPVLLLRILRATVQRLQPGL